MIDLDAYWEKTDEPYVWFNPMTQEYMFSDETEQFNGPFRTQGEALKALNQYCKDFL